MVAQPSKCRQDGGRPPGGATPQRTGASTPRHHGADRRHEALDVRSSRTPLVLRPLAWWIQTALGAVDAATRSAGRAVDTVGAVASAGISLAAVPVREGAKALAG